MYIKKGATIKKLRIDIDIETYSVLKGKMFEAQILTWDNFLRVIAQLLKDEEVMKKMKMISLALNQSIKEESKTEKEVKASTEMAKVINPVGDHDPNNS